MASRDTVELTAPARTMTRLIALPFRVLRPDAETDFLAFSLPDAITMSLTGTRNLLVRSSAAAARFDPQAPDLRKLAADADVDMALMGTILRAGSQLRATAQLVEAPAGTVVWSHSSQHALHDVFAMQDELVAGLVASLAESLGEPDEPRQPARRPAHAGGVRAVSARQRAGARLGSHSPRRSTSTSNAWRSTRSSRRPGPGSAGVSAILGKYFERPESTRDAERSFERAQTLNPELPVLHKYYAQLECDAGRAVDAMRRLLQRARRVVDPEYFAGLVHACRYAGLLEASVAAHEEARRLDPTVPTSVMNTLLMLGEYERLVRMTDGGDSDNKVLALYRLGRRDEALALWQRPPADAPPTYKAWDAMIVACLSDAPEARALAEEAVRLTNWADPEGYTVGGIMLARLGSHEMALEALSRAVDSGYSVTHPLIYDPWLAPLRDDPRFVRDRPSRRGAAERGAGHLPRRRRRAVARPARRRLTAGAVTAP